MEEKKLKVLVIEDEDLLLEAISKKLERDQMETILCRNAKEALDTLTSESMLPDIIWLDYYLPDMNGDELLRKLQEHPNWQKIPVLVVSNSANTKKVQSLLSMGAAKYILKAEYRLDQIVELIKKLVHEKNTVH